MTTEELAQQGALLTPLCPIISTYATDPMKMSPALKARLAQPESRAEYAPMAVG